MAKIQYIGKKPVKHDNVAGTGTVWNGTGDVQEVKDPLVVAQLLRHGSVWQMADGKAAPESPEPPQAKKPEPEPEHDNPPLVDLAAMDADGLREYAQREFGHTFHANMKNEGKMRDTIVGLMNRGN